MSKTKVDLARPKRDGNTILALGEAEEKKSESTLWKRLR